MKLRRALSAVVLVLAAGLPAASAWARPAQTLRVAIAKGRAELHITGVDLRIQDQYAQGVDLPASFNRNDLTLRARKGGIAVNQYLLPTDHIIVEAPSVYFRLGRRQYRGQMHIWKVNGRLLAVNHIDLEEYLVGLINHEINSEWPMPAVKAQAVVARTYALYQVSNARDERYDLESTVQDQVYSGAQAEDWRSARAVRETAGEVLVTRKGKLIQAYYHSCCGGHTELPENVWGQRTAMTRTIEDPFCKNAPKFSWTYTISPADFGARLASDGKPGGPVTSVKVLKRSESGRALRVRIETTQGKTTLSGNELRRIVGYSKIRSTLLRVSAAGGSFVFRGSGNGHGVGLCQWGAKGMGDTGKYNYRQILGYYYRGLYIRNLYKARRRARTRVRSASSQ